MKKYSSTKANASVEKNTVRKMLNIPCAHLQISTTLAVLIDAWSRRYPA